MACAVAVVCLFIFLFGWFWLGLWSLPPDRYEHSVEWWNDYALPRVVQALPFAVAGAAIVGWLTFLALGHLASSDRS